MAVPVPTGTDVVDVLVIWEVLVALVALVVLVAVVLVASVLELDVAVPGMHCEYQSFT